MRSAEWAVAVTVGEAVGIALVAVTLLSALRAVLGDGRFRDRDWRDRGTRSLALTFGFACVGIALLDLAYGATGLWFSGAFLGMGLGWFALTAYAARRFHTDG